MEPVCVVERHSAKEIARLAKNLNIDQAHAGFIEYMRDQYILNEHDYIKKKSREEEILTGTR